MIRSTLNGLDMNIPGKTLAASVALLLLTAPAWAADPVVPTPAFVEPPEEEAHDWTGPYIGLQGGFGWAQFEQTSGVFPLFASGSTLALNGPFIGVHAGYNQQWDNVVLGIEGDINAAWMRADFETGANRIPGSARIDWFGSIRARLGYAADETLLYATAGLAAAGANIDIPAVLPSDSQTHVGWTAGVGIEHMFDEDWSVRGEYRYHDFGTATYFSNIVATDVNLRMHTVKIGLSYHF